MTNLRELIQEFSQNKSTILDLQQKQSQITQKFNDLIHNYFLSINIFHYKNKLYIGNNVFISSPQFTYHIGETGPYWIAEGYKTSIVKGSYVDGHSKVSIYQKQWENLSLNEKHLTINIAKKFLKESQYPLIPKLHNGTNNGAPAYLLYKDDHTNCALVWRMSGIAYIDRMSKSINTKAGLEVLFLKNVSTTIQNDIKNKTLAQYPNASQSSQGFEIFQNKKLTTDLIMQESSKIDSIFGAGSSNQVLQLMNDIKEKKYILDSLIKSNNLLPEISSFIEEQKNNYLTQKDNIKSKDKELETIMIDGVKFKI